MGRELRATQPHTPLVSWLVRGAKRDGNGKKRQTGHCVCVRVLVGAGVVAHKHPKAKVSIERERQVQRVDIDLRARARRTAASVVSGSIPQLSCPSSRAWRVGRMA